MVTIEDLDGKSITEMTIEEGLELMRQIRLSRRTPPKKSRKSSGKPKTKAKKAPPKLSPEQAAELLKLLEDS